MSGLPQRLVFDPNDPETITFDLNGLVAVLAQAATCGRVLPDKDAYQHGQFILLHEVRAGISVLGRLAMGNVTKLEVSDE